MAHSTAIIEYTLCECALSIKIINIWVTNGRLPDANLS